MGYATPQESFCEATLRNHGYCAHSSPLVQAGQPDGAGGVHPGHLAEPHPGSVDYASQDASINREVRALLDVSHNPAARIAYNIDAELAQELVVGLLRSPAVIRAEIIDNAGVPLASADRPPAESHLRGLSDFLFGQQRTYEEPLFVEHAPAESLGVLRLEIDTFVFGNDFLRRAGMTFISGFIRSLMLSLILLVLFYALLTKPLVSLIEALSRHDPRSPSRLRLPCREAMSATRSVCWWRSPIASSTASRWRWNSAARRRTA